MAAESIDRMVELLQGVFQEKDGLKVLLEALVNVGMREEAAKHVGADRHERAEDRRGYRNGNKPRALLTRVGKLELSVPQVRGCEPYHPSMFGKWERSERALLVSCAEMYFQGVSTRGVRDVLEVMCDGEISSSVVSRVAGELDEKLRSFRERRLDGCEWPYLMIDARYEKVRVEGRVISQAVLVVIGFSSGGQREVLDWRVADSESEATWGQVFLDLKLRGVRGVKLVVSDAHQGIRSAMSRHFQGVAWQRCRVHFKRELGRKVSYKVLKEVMADLGAVLAAEEKDECLRRAEEMACKWEARYAAVARMLREGVEDCLTVLGFAQTHRKRLASTNLAENLMKQLKRRTAVVGVFPNRSSCDRLIGALLMETHERWQTELRPWFNMELAG